MKGALKCRGIAGLGTSRNRQIYRHEYLRSDATRRAQLQDVYVGRDTGSCRYVM